MESKSKAAPEVPGRTEKEEADLRGHVGKVIVEKWLIKLTWTEAYQKLQAVESILETLQENGIDSVEAALESVRLAGSISAYLCKDGTYAQRDFEKWLEENAGSVRSDGSNG